MSSRLRLAVPAQGAQGQGAKREGQQCAADDQQTIGRRRGLGDGSVQLDVQIGPLVHGDRALESENAALLGNAGADAGGKGSEGVAHNRIFSFSSRMAEQLPLRRMLLTPPHQGRLRDAATRRSTWAAPMGVRLPCSQWCEVRTLMPNTCVNLRRKPDFDRRGELPRYTLSG